jgi:hypothetical protein
MDISQDIDTIGACMDIREEWTTFVLSGYFWIVMTKRQESGTCKIMAMKFSHDDIVQNWRIETASDEEMGLFIQKLSKAEGTNNVCVLNNSEDFDNIGKAIDEMRQVTCNK